MSNRGEIQVTSRMSALLTDKTSKLLAIFALGLAALSVLWWAGASSSLWLDETITAWIVSAPLAIVTERVLSFQGQSPLYFWMLSLVVKYCGFSELILRVPSILAGLAALSLLYRVARNWFSSQASFFSIALMLGQADFLRALFSSRPYIFAELFLVGSLWLLTRWCRNSRTITLLAAALSYLIAFYFHYLVALSFFPVFLMPLAMGKNRKKIFKLVNLGVLFTVALVAIPGILQMFSLEQRIGVYSFAPPVSFAAFFRMIIPLETAFLLVTSLVLLFTFVPKGYSGLKCGERSLLTTLLLIVALPPITLLILSLLVGESFLLSRYALGSTIGVALIGAWIIDCLKCSPSRWWAISIISLLIIINPREWHHEDWRSSLKEFKQSLPDARSVILLYSGLAEAQDAAWLMSLDNRDYLTTPVQIYASGHEVFPIPRSQSTAEIEHYIQKIVSPALKTKSRVFLVALRSSKEKSRGEESSVVDAYQSLLAAQGFVRNNPEGDKGELITKALFSRPGAKVG